MKRFAIFSACVLCVVTMALPAFAAGPHDMDCMECHTTHYAQADYAIAVAPSTQANPARTRAATDIDAICLGCHNEDEGIMPVNLATSHPTGVTPTYTQVPNELLWDGVFTCVSCHNPHPSNTNARYLIVSTDQGMGVFCAKCHPLQSDPDIRALADQLTITSDPAVPPIVPVVPAPVQ